MRADSVGIHEVSHHLIDGRVVNYFYTHATSGIGDLSMPYDEAVRLAEILERMTGDVTKIQARLAGKTYDVMRFTGTRWVRG